MNSICKGRWGSRRRKCNEKKTLYYKKIEGKIKIDFTNKYETGGEVVECEFLDPCLRMMTILIILRLRRPKSE